MNRNEVDNAAGKRRAEFEQAYRDTVDRIFAYIQKRVGDAEVALDLTQKTYIRAFEQFARYKPGAKPYIAFLYTVASNIIVDEWRKTTKQKQVPLEEETLAAKDANPETDAVLARQALAPHLAKLSEDFRLILELRYFAELEPAEISSLTGWSIDKVGVTHHRALRRLASLMS